MIPTVFGVIVITFILFNIVYGSPASITLGKNVSPKALEEFDEQRGFNKPLFFGNWVSTRAYSDSSFTRNAGLWRRIKDITYISPSAGERGYIILSPGISYQVPLGFNLKPNTSYCWLMTYRLKQGKASVATGLPADNLQGALKDNTNEFLIPNATEWRHITIPFAFGAESLPIFFHSEGGSLEISVLELRRKTLSFLDSQFAFYLHQIIHFDFGISSYTNQRISQMLKDGILPSLSLTIPIFLIGIVLSVCISLICAFFRNTWLDRTIVFIAVILMSVNYLVWIVAGQYILGFRLRLFPIWGYESWKYLLLPVLIAVVHGLGTNVRFYRTVMLDEMYRDYVRTAFAKGLSPASVLFKHVLKNALIPILTNVIIAIPFLYTGSLLLEYFFGIPGLGNMSINAINASDIDVVRSIVFIGAVLYVIANLMTDVFYALVDPRVKLQ